MYITRYKSQDPCHQLPVCDEKKISIKILGVQKSLAGLGLGFECSWSTGCWCRWCQCSTSKALLDPSLLEKIMAWSVSTYVTPNP